MSGKFELKCKSELHNYFEIEVYEEGRLKQAAYAQNVITETFFKSSSGEKWYIEVGSGAGEPSSGDTSLFSPIRSFGTYGQHYVISEKDHIYGVKFEARIQPEELVGEKITEIGLKEGYHTPELLTHAMIKDGEGNPITINKSATDEIKIKAHMIATVTYPNEHCFSFMGGINNISTMLLPTAYGHPSPASVIIVIGINASSFTEFVGDDYYNGHEKLFNYTQHGQTLINKKRFKTDKANMGIHSIVLGNDIIMPVTSLPDWTGFEINGEVLGMGDGSNKEFMINWVEPTEIKIFKNNNLVESTEYSIVPVDNYVLYNWKFINVFKLSHINYEGNNKIILCYKHETLNKFLANFKEHYKIVLFNIIDNDIDCLSWIDSGDRGFKSYGNLRTIKRLSDNQYYNIIDNRFVPCSESEALSTIEDVSLNSSYEFDNGIIKIKKESSFHVPYKNVVKKKVVFNTAPSVNEEIKANYHVNYIPKDDKHVLDITFTMVKTAGQGS